jgi:hypothetical protein
MSAFTWVHGLLFLALAGLVASILFYVANAGQMMLEVRRLKMANPTALQVSSPALRRHSKRTFAALGLFVIALGTLALVVIIGRRFVEG